jgi:hypothetical protein
MKFAIVILYVPVCEETLPDVFLFGAKFTSKIKGLVDSKAHRIRLKSTSNLTKIRTRFSLNLVQIVAFPKSPEALKWLVSAQKINSGGGFAFLLTFSSLCPSRRFHGIAAAHRSKPASNSASAAAFQRRAPKIIFEKNSQNARSHQ